MENKSILCIEDNGIGLSREDFIKYCKPYINPDNNKEIQGLELNIAVSIILQHGFDIYPVKKETGTIFKIDLDTSFKEYILDNSFIRGAYPDYIKDKK